ncbi:cbb3-type cytochrome c oxidase subunit I [Streptomyces sp. NPDC002172]
MPSYSRHDLADLSAFAAICRRGSFRLAATELGVSTSALSHALRNLEARLGVKLLYRTTRSVAPTEAGSRLAAQLDQSFGEIGEALSELGRYRSGPLGGLRINVPRDASRLLLSPVLARYLEDYPGVKIEVVVDNNMVDIVKAGFDAGMRFGDTVPQDMVCTPLTPPLRWVVVGAPAYLGRHGTTTLTAVNFLATVLCLRAPGMTMFRMPMFTWNVLFTSILVLPAFPVLTAALLALESDRKFGSHVFDAHNGGALLWQHLFWFFGHPEVYIVALPFFGIVSEIIPVFSRKPLFGYLPMIGATISITMLSAVVWAHHMFATGAVLLPFFSIMSFLIAVPTGIKFFAWIGTMRGGSLSFETPMLWSMGFLVTFLLGGLSGVLVASPPLDFHVTDSYFIVAHLHYVLFGTVVFATFAGFYFWWPKFTGKMLDERWGKVHFWLLFPGFQLTFLVQHWLGAEGMPRRYADYLPADGFTLLNTLSSAGAFLLGVSTLPFLYNVWLTAHRGRQVEEDDPWGYGRGLEWATSCPPPRHNFVALPRVRSESPAFDLHHPEILRLAERKGLR